MRITIAMLKAARPSHSRSMSSFAPVRKLQRRVMVMRAEGARMKYGASGVSCQLSVVSCPN
jgi:hypothetical protein